MNAYVMSQYGWLVIPDAETLEVDANVIHVKDASGAIVAVVPFGPNDMVTLGKQPPMWVPGTEGWRPGPAPDKKAPLQ